jgi:hypothetical protein
MTTARQTHNHGWGLSDEPLVNEHAAAHWLGVAAATLRRWRWQGGGPPFVRVGRHVRYAPAVLREYVERHTCTSTSATKATGIGL